MIASQRQQYLQKLCQALPRYFPTIQILVAKMGSVFRYGYKPGIARLLFALSSAPAAVIAAVGSASWERAEVIHALLAQGIIWVQEMQQRTKISALYLLVPTQYLTIFQRRISLLSFPYPIQIFAVNEADQIQLSTPSVPSLLKGCSSSQLPRYRPPSDRRNLPLATVIDNIKSLNPAITELHTPQRLKLAIHGLVFATTRGNKQSEIWFGVDQPQRLTKDNYHQLRALIAEISYYRQANSVDKQHRFYTMAAEAWLESVVCQQLTRLDPELQPGRIYRQVPQLDPTGRHFVDLLAVRRDGQIVVIELKVTEDEMLPFQALDYWWHVERHRRRGDFKRRGYFLRQPLNSQPCWIYLVAPIFRFHRRCRELTATINPQIPVFGIAINNDWRENLTIYRREWWNPTEANN
jgi:hypothetical protein